MARVSHRGESATEGRAAGKPRCTTPSSSWLIVVLDTGGVEGLAPIDEARRARLRLLREQADDLVVPAAVFAESVLTGHPGHDYHVERVLDLLTVTNIDAPLGHAAGLLRRAAMIGGQDPPPSGVDALVAATADGRAASDDVLIVTSDGDDFELMGALATHADRLSVVVV
jgi:predicted nucleic acid-binding protein